ncbi:MAG: CidA/LrgA family protein [Lachnospiraceae bacterium]|nr:CidA/LrgA family protein [Lachnospiraceae bacterium]
MKYLKQLAIILTVSVVAEVMSYFIPLSVPASVYGLVLMVILLLLKIVKLDQVEDTADFMLSIMPFFFVAPTVSLMTSFDAIKGNVIVLVLMCLVSSIVVIIVTGLVAQAIIRFRHRKEEKKNA